MAGKPSSASEHRQDVDATEQTPLLGQPGEGLLVPDADPEAVGALSKAEKKQLPKLQIFLLCFARLTEPIAFFCIFPFIAQMVQRNGNLPESDVGFYSGLIESLFSATQMVVLIFWGRLADRIGRKPVLICSMAGMTVGTILFGTATTIGEMILYRCLAGVFSGSSLIIRTMIAENSNPENQALAFSWFAFGGNLGIFLGPILGGVVADPAHQYPGLFKGIAFFEKYPYALPTMVSGAICAISTIVSALYLKETLIKEESSSSQTNGSSNGTSSTNQQSQMTMWELVKVPGVAFVIWIYSHAMLLAFAFTAILPVALYTPVKIGGFGFGLSLISTYMAIQGASQSLWLLIAFPRLQHRFGTRGVMQICGFVYPLFFAGFVVLNTLLRQGSQPAVVAFWIIGTVVALVGPGVSMAFTAVQLALNDCSPSPHVLGTLNAIALTAASAIRSVVPGVSTAIYAVGVRNQILWGHLAWALLIPLTLIFTVSAGMMPNDKKLQKNEDEEDS